MAQALQHDQTALSHRISTTRATNDQPVPDAAGSGGPNAITSPSRWYKKTVRPIKRLVVGANAKPGIAHDLAEMHRCSDEKQAYERGRRCAQHYVEIVPRVNQVHGFGAHII